MALLVFVVKLEVFMIFLVLSETFRLQTTEYIKVKKPYDPQKKEWFYISIVFRMAKFKKNTALPGFFTNLKAFRMNLDSHSFIS